MFTAIDHVGIAVADYQNGIDFYTGTFGMTVLHEEVNEEQGVREAMLAPGSDASGTQIQLLAPLTLESTIAKFLDRNGPGIQQIAYRVTDVAATAATLRERGLRLLYDAPKRGHGREPGQLHSPQGRRRHPRRARPTRHGPPDRATVSRVRLFTPCCTGSLLAGRVRHHLLIREVKR